MRRVLAALVIATGMTFAMVACGGGAEPGEAERREESPAQTQSPTAEAAGPRLANQWAGRVEGTNAYISVFTLDNGQAGAYLADGQMIATLVLGRIENGRLALEPARGTSVTGTVTGDMVQGDATIDGVGHKFTAEKATGTAGWYRGRANIGGQPVAAGYIILADGSQRGAVRRGEQLLGTPRFDPANPVIQIEGTSVTVLPVAEFVEREGGLS